MIDILNIDRWIRDCKQFLTRSAAGQSSSYQEYDMMINFKTTKVMRVHRNGSKREGGNTVKINIEGQKVKQVNQFR